MRVLLVEDDERLGNVVCQVLNRANIEFDWAKNSEETFEFVDYSSCDIYDVIILDWMLPGKNGPEICQILRNPQRYNYQGGIIFLTARDSTSDMVTGLETGADDYIVKPFENSELIARLNAVNRRKSKPFIDDIFKLGNLSLNRNEKIVSYKNKNIKLSKKEFELFDLLLININQTLPRNTIIEHIWGTDSDVTSANLDSYIYLLRKKTKDLTPEISINLIRGIGYKVQRKTND